MNTTPNLSQEEHNLILYLVIAKKYEMEKYIRNHPDNIEYNNGLKIILKVADKLIHTFRWSKNDIDKILDTLN